MVNALKKGKEAYIDDQAKFDSLTERQRMEAGYPYKPGNEELREGRANARRLTHKFNTSGPEDKPLRLEIIKELFGSIQGKPFIEPTFRCDYGFNIHVGTGLEMNFDCVILDCARVDIGDRVLFAPNVHIYTATHPLDYMDRRDFELAKPVKIGDDVWIGGNVSIMPGVTIGNRVVVGAGAVVTKDVEDDVVVAGNPAKVIRRLKD